MDSCETLLNMENNMEEEFTNRNSTSSTASSDFSIPQRGVSLLDSTRKARSKSFAGPPNPSPIPSPALTNVKTNNSKDSDVSQGDSSKAVPPSPSSINDPFIGPMSRSFSVSSSNNSPNINMSFSNDYNLRPISSLYRTHSVGSRDQRASRNNHETSLNNRYSSYEANRSRSLSPNHKKPTLSVLPGNINANGGVVRGISSSTPPVINYSEGKVLENKKESITSPLSQNALSLQTFRNTPPQSPHIDNVNKNLPHKYVSKSSVESESNVKEAGYHFVHNFPEEQNQNIVDTVIVDKVNGQNISPKDNRVSVQNSTVSVQSVSSINSRLNSDSIGNLGRSNTDDSVNSGLLNPHSRTGTPEIVNTNVIKRENITLPVSKRKSSIPKPPILYQEPVNEIPKRKMISSYCKKSEKEVFNTLFNLLDQLESNQNQSNQQQISTTVSDRNARIQEALDHLEKSYFPEGREVNESKLPILAETLPKSPLINTINERDIIAKVVKKESVDRVHTPPNVGISEHEVFKVNKNSPARIRGQEELQRILNNSAPSLQIKSMKERSKQQQQYKLSQLQQKQEFRIKKIQNYQQQQIQNQLKHQINQKLQQNAMIQQKLKQLGNDPNSMSVSPSMINPEFNSPVSELSVIDFGGDINPRRIDSIIPMVSPVSTNSSMDNLSVVSISTRPRKTSLNKQHYIPIPQVNGKDASSSISNSYESSMKPYSPGVSTISANSSRISPNQSFSGMPVMVPNLGYSPSVQSRSFSVDVANESSIPRIQQHKVYSRSPSHQCVDISTSEEAKKQRKSKTHSIFYIPPENSSKPLSAVVSDVSDVNMENELETVTKNNTIINSNSNSIPGVNSNVRNSLYKNTFNLSADNLTRLKEKTEVVNSPIRKSNSYGSGLNNYGVVDGRQSEFRRFEEGETIIDHIFNELNITTGFENNILRQRAQLEEERRALDARRRTHLQNQVIANNPKTSTNIH